jgi:hypothetical protein
MQYLCGPAAVKGGVRPPTFGSMQFRVLLSQQTGEKEMSSREGLAPC